MKRTARVIPLFAMLAACTQSSPPSQTGSGGAPSNGSGGTSPNGSGGGTGSSSGGASGSASGGTTGSASGGTTGSASGGTTGSASGGTTGAASGGTTGSASGGTTGTGSGGTTGSASGGTTGTGSGGRAGGAPGNGSGGAGTGSGGQGGTMTGMCAPPTTTIGTSNDAVAGTLVQFNDNGGWCWYQDERVVVDPKAQKMFIGSVASGSGRDGNVEAVVYDVAAGTASKPTVLGTLSVDDHSAAAFAMRPDGKVVAMWAGHRVDCNSYFSLYDGTSWAAKKSFDWKTQGCPWDGDDTHMITYSNLWYMSTESRFYSGVRSVSTSPNVLTSTDDGATFGYYGRLTSTPTVGYVAGYYKYWGNGTDRIDFVGTENHPRDFDNNLWHGYIKGGKVYNSTGTAVDDSIADKTAQEIGKFTKIFSTGSMVGPVKISHAWNADLVRYDDGNIALIWTGRANTTTSTDTPDLRLLYARYDGSTWKLTYLGKAGPKLYADEQDYTGLGALDPDDPHTIYISSPIDPRDDTTNLGKREIFQGTTCDNGATFKWTPITQKSTVDNFRPVVPKWDSQHRALLWLRGTYMTAQKYSTKVVGLVGAR